MSPTINVEIAADGLMRLQSRRVLGPYPSKITERLDHWAAKAPERIFLAERDHDGRWRTVTYGQFQGFARAAAQGLLDWQCTADRPVAILSPNSIDHALVSYAAMYIGVPSAPISPWYDKASSDPSMLQRVLASIRPSFVFRDELLPALIAKAATKAVEEAHAKVDGDTVAKILFTSGSTGDPKPVITTQRMLCSNQQMLRESLPILAEQLPVLCDWLPWHHAYGGNHNLGLVLYNGGTMYIDAGRPVPSSIDKTVRNLREIPANLSFNVPRGFSALLPFLREDGILRERFFSRLHALFSAGATLPTSVSGELRDLGVETCGRDIPVLAGFGSTETAPFCLFTSSSVLPGGIGLPVPGVELKLVPVEGRLEARVRGPNVTPGYWERPDLTQQSFDAAGFYRFGDAVRFVEPLDIEQGLVFAGRLDEDFKLSSGTWVHVEPLRERVLRLGSSFVEDVIIVGPGQDYLAMLILPADNIPDVSNKVQSLLDQSSNIDTSSSHRIQRAALLEESSLAADERNPKGGLNARGLRQNRNEMISSLYGEPAPQWAICATKAD